MTIFSILLGHELEYNCTTYLIKLKETEDPDTHVHDPEQFFQFQLGLWKKNQKA